MRAGAFCTLKMCHQDAQSVFFQTTYFHGCIRDARKLDTCLMQRYHNFTLRLVIQGEKQHSCPGNWAVLKVHQALTTGCFPWRRSQFCCCFFEERKKFKRTFVLFLARAELGKRINPEEHFGTLVTGLIPGACTVASSVACCTMTPALASGMGY